MKRITTIILLLCTVLTASALDKRQTRINSIKKSKEYLYSDITMSSREDANSQAVELLQNEIIAWAKDRAENKKAEPISPIEINKLIDTIMVRRANMYRVFAYVKKVKLVPLFSEWNLVLLDDKDSDDGIDIEGLPEEDKKEQAYQPEDTEPKEFPEPADTVKIQTPEKKDTVASKDIRTILKNSFWGKKGGVIEQIKKAKNFFELKQIMEPLKEKGDIKAYGKYATARNLKSAISWFMILPEISRLSWAKVTRYAKTLRLARMTASGTIVDAVPSGLPLTKQIKSKRYETTNIRFDIRHLPFFVYNGIQSGSSGYQ